ncbi:endonuclease/exonuclease/phosphatase family protein [Saccharothrix deserti]|uniref:endonuclease/exonuclease/phosphatase family protein n=1 Tax=Saccharothrix deserti TaxID=2593674 RepID=UPI00131E8DE0|nr:endonuclease/exonuclease/phosphatase family protein [Saccharothrix deserti]
MSLPKKGLSLLLGLLAALGTVSALGIGSAQAATSVKVMTWNWEIPKSLSYQRGWTNVVKNQKPDILGLQEICVKWVQQLVDDMKNEAGVDYDVVYGTWRTDRRCGGTPGTEGANGDAILVKRKTASIVGKGSFRLPVVAKSKDKEERGVVWAKVKVGSRVIPVWNTHIGIKNSQTEQIAALANATGKPAAGIVLGDFNSTPGDSAIRPMWKNGWKEADARCTPSGCRGTHDNGKKFDYIFLRGLRGSAPKSIPTPSSDHHVVIASVKI